jgi:DNA-binding beta-propeller fold protein YncE
VVLNKGAAQATFVDLASGTVVGTLPTGEGPHELTMSSDGRVAVGTDYGGRGGGGNSLTVFDVEAMEVIRTIDLGEYRRPHGIHFLPGDEVVAVTVEANDAVLLVSVADGTVEEVLRTEAGGSHMVAVTGDGETLYTGDMRDGTVSRLEVEAGGRTRSYEVPPTPEAVTVSADGSTVWVGSNEEGTVSTLDTSTGRVDTVLEEVGWPYRILLVPDHDLVVVPDLRASEVRFLRLSTREELPRLELPGTAPQGVALSGDGASLFLSLNRAGEVAVIDLETRRVVRRLPAGPTPDGVGWSPVEHR